MDYGEKLFGYGCIVTILVIIIAVAWGNQLSNEKITRMVEAGANPVDAACAISGGQLTCTLAGRN